MLGFGAWKLHERRLPSLTSFEFWYFRCLSGWHAQGMLITRMPSWLGAGVRLQLDMPPLHSGETLAPAHAHTHAHAHKQPLLPLRPHADTFTSQIDVRKLLSHTCIIHNILRDTCRFGCLRCLCFDICNFSDTLLPMVASAA